MDKGVIVGTNAVENQEQVDGCDHFQFDGCIRTPGLLMID